MKRLLFLSLVVVFTQCKKDKTTPNNPTPTTPTILGSWTNNESSDRKPTFTADSVFWTGMPGYPYKVSGDTFYRTYPTGAPADPQFRFKINTTNDTFYYYGIGRYAKNNVYWRAK